MATSPQARTTAANGSLVGKRRRHIVIGLVAAIVGGGAGVAVAMVQKQETGRGPARAVEEHAAAKVPMRRPIANSLGAAFKSAPDGFRVVKDESGFVIAVPSDWSRKERSGNSDLVEFAPAKKSEGISIQISRTADGSEQDPPTIHAAIASTDETLRGTPGSYRQVMLSDGKFLGVDATRWNYDVKPKKNGAFVYHATQNFIDPAGQMWDLSVIGPATHSGRSDADRLFEVVGSHFQIYRMV